MWFKNLQIFRFCSDLTSDALGDQLAKQPLQPCRGNQPLSYGWVPPRSGGAYVHVTNRQWLIALGIEQKLLPAAVIRQYAQERAEAIESHEGRSVGRREFRELSDQVTSELLQRAFVRRHKTCAWLDPVNGWLVIDAAAPARADELLEQLHKSVEGFTLLPVKVACTPAAAMTRWLEDGDAPAGFTLDSDAELLSAESAVVRYARHPLDSEDIPRHIAAGKIVTRLALTWNDRISFLLDNRLQLKRLSFLDIMKEESEGQAENEEERFDLDFTLMTGELAKLLADLMAALGGEIAEAA